MKRVGFCDVFMAPPAIHRGDRPVVWPGLFVHSVVAVGAPERPMDRPADFAYADVDGNDVAAPCDLQDGIPMAGEAGLVGVGGAKRRPQRNRRRSGGGQPEKGKHPPRCPKPENSTT